MTYEPWTEHYRRGLAEISRALAAEFDAVAELAAELSGNPLTDGLTLSGGEPMEQAEDCLRLAAGAAACRIETGHQGIPSAREVLERARAGWEKLGTAPEGGWAETAEGLYASPRDSLQG